MSYDAAEHGLDLYAENESALYGQFQSIIKNCTGTTLLLKDTARNLVATCALAFQRHCGRDWRKSVLRTNTTTSSAVSTGLSL